MTTKAKKTKTEHKQPDEKRPVGRPSELPQTLEKAKEYLNGGWKDIGDLVPSIASLACYCGKHRDNIYEYMKQSQEFTDIAKAISTLQESTLLRGGLSGDFNPSISKLILSKHGYSDKVEQDVRSSDGSMSPAPTRIVFEIVDGDE